MNKGYFLVFLTAVISGFAIFLNKYGVTVVDPYTYTFLRVLVVAVFLSGLLLALNDRRILKNLTKKQWTLLIIIGLVGGSIPFLLFFKGLSLTNAAQGSFVHKTMFIYAAFFAAALLKEKIGKKFLFGGLFLLLGSSLLLTKVPHSLNTGDLLIFSAAILWALENTIAKYVLGDLPGRTVAWARMFFGAFFILLFLLGTHRLPLENTLTAEQISWVLLTSAILFGYVLTWYSGLKLIPVHKATAILLLGSPITTFLVLISGGGINPREILAGVFIILGTVFVVGIKETRKALEKIKGFGYVRIQN